ncbi:M20 peptidase aminoacylase family protein [Caldifermentibacillus hisashii]|uniref:M20 peptidase aminoacylase family protein n=1 Tax=Caldifermentibacillus hisashii TaxID=996558 RepID=UPI0034D66D0A
MRAIEQEVIDTYRYLHNHPEISWHEFKTTAYIKEKLKEYCSKVITFKNHTGVIGEFGNFDGKRPVVGLRADIDALWQEVEGKFKPNHSCGHDAHTAIILGVLWKLAEEKLLHDKVATKFIFQPAEETGDGALMMIQNHVIDNLDYLYGIHVRPYHETPMGVAAPVIIHGAAKNYEGVINGEDAHGARPHLNINAIEVGAQIVNLLNQIHLDPTVPHSVKMTKFQAGGKSLNIIPGNASFGLDLRAQNNKLMNTLDKKVQEILSTIANLYGVTIELTHEDYVPAAVLNDTAISIMKKAIIETVGENNMKPSILTPGGDDFHFYSIKKPTLKATMLGLGCDLRPGLHHPLMTLNEEALLIGVNILFRAIIKTYGL